MKRRGFIAAAAAAATGAAALSGCDAAHEIEGGFTGIDVARGHALRDHEFAAAAAPREVRRTRVLIAGGGISGLAAARALRLAGIEDFVLLELEDTAGGNSRGGMVGGIACPLGAHYLPLPADAALEVQDLLEELGLRRRVSGRWEYDEIHLCHSPQERLYRDGAWQDGLLPMQDVPAATLVQYRRFARRVDELGRAARFVIPTLRAEVSAELLELDGRSFSAWLAREGFDDPRLLWYLDYCCRDDYGAGMAAVSAWAGIHYFASRHGFHVPGDDPGDSERDDADQGAVLTWPEGNAWLARRLAAPLGERLRSAHAVVRIAEQRGGVELDAVDLKGPGGPVPVRWQAERCIVALPVFIAARVIENPPAQVLAAAAQLRYSPWLVANVHLRAPLADRPGAPPCWDNVTYGSAGLGYVDARHQSLSPMPGPTVLSWYRPLGPSEWDGADARRKLLERPWTGWRDDLLAELAQPHPDLRSLATRIEITRYGHAMAIPAPGLLRQLGARPQIRCGRLAFAHADWSGYSIFEEAFTRGTLAAAT